MLTFTDQVNIAKSISGVADAANVTNFKRDINTGGTRFMAIMARPFDRQSRFADQVANQQYFTYAVDMLRLSDIIVQTGTVWRPLTEITDENEWRLLNQTTVNGIPYYYFVRGFNEVGLYPIPSATIIAGLELVFEPKHVLLTQDDFTTGTVITTNDSQTITHSAAGFTNAMVGRFFQTTDGSDGNWYRIQSYTDASNLVLENYFIGLSSNLASFRIGQVMNIPEEFHEAPVDYAMHRYYLQRGDRTQATDFRSLFEGSLAACQDLYGQSSSNQIVTANENIRVWNPLLDTPNKIGT